MLLNTIKVISCVSQRHPIYALRSRSSWNIQRNSENRRTGGISSRRRRENCAIEQDENFEQLFEEAESVEDWVCEGMEGKESLPHDARRRDEQFRKRHVYKVIEHKYFRPPQESNLLTYKAKEQMRYLHAEFPHEWTVERLSESFPVSEAGVRKILSSSFVPRTKQEILKHDARVQQHWALLHPGVGKDKKAITAGPIVVEPPAELKNADGIKSLSLSRPAGGIEARMDKLMQKRAHKNNIKTTPLFESIVKDYCAKNNKPK